MGPGIRGTLAAGRPLRLSLSGIQKFTFNDLNGNIINIFTQNNANEPTPPLRTPRIVSRFFILKLLFSVPPSSQT